MSDDTYTCVMCRETFGKGWSDEESEAEFATNFPNDADSERNIVCDDCFKKLRKFHGDASPTE